MAWGYQKRIYTAGNYISIQVKKRGFTNWMIRVMGVKCFSCRLKLFSKQQKEAVTASGYTKEQD